MGADLKKLSHRHEAILEYMVMFPAKPLGDVAAHFDVTPAWLSMIIHSDLFQERLSGVIASGHECGIFTIKEKMAATASMTLDRLMERIPVEPDIGELSKVANVTLRGLGYGAPKGADQPGVGMQQNNIFVTDASQLQQARETMAKFHSMVPAPRYASQEQNELNTIKGEAEVIHDSDKGETG